MTTTAADSVTVHELKCVQPFFDDIEAGRKTFEIRRNDRDFQIGDVLLLIEHPLQRNKGPRIFAAEVVYMTDFEQKPGYVVMGIRKW